MPDVSYLSCQLQLAKDYPAVIRNPQFASPAFPSTRPSRACTIVAVSDSLASQSRRTTPFQMTMHALLAEALHNRMALPDSP